MRKKSLDLDQVIQALNEDRIVEKSQIPVKVLRRKVWLAEWHFFGCLSETRSISLKKTDAIDSACVWAETENGVPRGMKSWLRMWNHWNGPAYGSNSDIQCTTISKVSIEELI